MIPALHKPPLFGDSRSQEVVDVLIIGSGFGHGSKARTDTPRN